MNRTQMMVLIEEVVTGVLPGLDPRRFDEGLHFKELGADSVDRVEIILGLIGRLGIDEPMSSFSELPNIGALADFLADRS